MHPPIVALGCLPLTSTILSPDAIATNRKEANNQPLPGGDKCDGHCFRRFLSQHEGLLELVIWRLSVRFLIS
jgi:hypothetical protein